MHYEMRNCEMKSVKSFVGHPVELSLEYILVTFVPNFPQHHKNNSLVLWLGDPPTCCPHCHGCQGWHFHSPSLAS